MVNVKLVLYSHNKGLEKVAKHILHPLQWELQRLEVTRTKRGSSEITDAIQKVLSSNGWSGRTRVHPDSPITITSINENVGLCLQFANMYMFSADLLKLEVMYERKIIDSAIYILPVLDLARELGSNMVNFERFTQELDIYKNIIKIPIMVIGIEDID